MILLDTNILLRHARAADPDFATVDTAINALHAGGEMLCVVPQNIYEFWAHTPPGRSPRMGSVCRSPSVRFEVARIKRLFRFIPDLPTLFDEWEALIVRPRLSRPRLVRRPARRRHADPRHHPAAHLQHGPTSPGFPASPSSSSTASEVAGSHHIASASGCPMAKLPAVNGQGE